MKQTAAALLSGLVFGFGLTLSGMINPARVVGFLDIAGAWDPTLVFVMCGALAVTIPVFPQVLRKSQPLLAERFVLPAAHRIDLPLLAGSAVFGVGWGVSGFCPGPAIAALYSGSPAALQFVAAMVAGQWMVSRFWRRT